MSELAHTTLRGPLFRLAHRPDPWAWPPWTYCRRANRWDDPTDTYRVLYGSTERRAPFLETLARFRPDPAVSAGLAQISGPDEGALPPGHVPDSWVTVRMIGTATVGGRFADIGDSASLAHLQEVLAARLIHYSYRELDGAVIREARREFTQEISLYVFGRADGAGTPLFSGIAYRSRLGDEFTNWAVFERPDQDPVQNATAADLSVDDPDLLATFSLFGLTLVPGR
jgi:hypothetical protein